MFVNTPTIRAELTYSPNNLIRTVRSKFNCTAWICMRIFEPQFTAPLEEIIEKQI